MEHNQQVFVASEVEISELKQNDIFLEIDLCLCSTRPNKNRESVTEAFIDEIVANLDTYECLPLYCDVNRLLAGQYDRLTHMQNKRTGTFGTTQIGSLRNFRKEKIDQVSRLIATARIPKREADICQNLINMYEQDILCFSFEVAYVLSDTVVEQGTRFVDASDRNFIFGMTVVSRPAYEESVSLKLVAEDTAEATKGTEDGETPEMDQMEKKDLAVEVAEEVTEETVEAVEEVTQEVVAEEENANAENDEAVAENTVGEVIAEEVTVEEANEPETEVETVAEETAEVVEPSVETVAESDSDTEDTPAETVAEQTDNAEDTPDTHEAVETVNDNETMSAMTMQDCPCAEVTQQDIEIDAAHVQIDAEMARLRAVIAQYEAELEALRAEHLELEAIRAAQKAQELQMRQNQARVFAQHEGLSLEDTAVAEAINAVDYETLVSMSMKNISSDVTVAETIVPAINVTPDVKLTDNRGWLFQKADASL